MLNVQGAMIFPDGSWALSPTWRASFDVSLSDICDKHQERHDDARLVSKRNTAVFILVYALLKSNSPTSSLIVLCCKIQCPDRLWATTFIVWRTAL
jgi:hypothetical protein